MIDDIVQEILKKRINKVKPSYTKNTNCIGTALYLTGLIDKELALCPDVVFNTFLKNLDKFSIDEIVPEVGTLIAYEHVYRGGICVLHMGVVTDTEPIRLMHRQGYAGMIMIDDSIERLNKEYIRPWCSPFYYLPKLD